jgi:hypothetical protein
MSFHEWLKASIAANMSIPTMITIVTNAIPPFLSVLQSLVQNQTDQFIHVDLHVGNMFVRPLNNGTIQLGIADFGQCFLRHRADPPEKQAKEFYGKYLCDFISRYKFATGFTQAPIESRLLNFCYQNNFDNKSPSELIKAWGLESAKTRTSHREPFLINIVDNVNFLLKKPVFISMIEAIQGISKKTRVSPTDPVKVGLSLSPLEKTVVEFILTRYVVLSPINTITEDIMNNDKSFLPNKPASNILIEFLTRSIMAPYDQEGSSLATALTSVQSADLGIAWTDVVNELRHS